MSELDRIYQEFYEKVTQKIGDEYEVFKTEKSDWQEAALIKDYIKELNQIAKNIIDSIELVEINKTDYAVRGYNPLRQFLIPDFRTNKTEKYKANPVQNFLNNNLNQVIKRAQEEYFNKLQNTQQPEFQDSFFVPSKEELAKILAVVDAYDDYAKRLTQLLFSEKSETFPSMSTKQTLRQWIAEGELEQVIQSLQQIANQLGNTNFINDVTHQAGRYASLKKKEQQNIIDERDAGIELAKIRQALLDLINKVPDNTTLQHSTVTPTPVPAQEPLASATPPTDNPNPTQNSLKNLWIVGLGVLVGVTLLAALIPCPSDFLSGTTQVLMAMGAAMAATALPGLLNIDLPNVKTGSALAVLVLVYLFNPAKLVENNSRCNNEPFEFTINLQPDKYTVVSAQYPKLENATLQLWINNKWEDATVSSDNLADFKSIQGS